MIFKIILIAIFAMCLYYYALLIAQLCGLIVLKGSENIDKNFDFKYLIPFYQFYKLFKNV